MVNMQWWLVIILIAIIGIITFVAGYSQGQNSDKKPCLTKEQECYNNLGKEIKNLQQIVGVEPNNNRKYKMYLIKRTDNDYDKSDYVGYSCIATSSKEAISFGPVGDFVDHPGYWPLNDRDVSCTFLGYTDYVRPAFIATLYEAQL